MSSYFPWTRIFSMLQLILIFGLWAIVNASHLRKVTAIISCDISPVKLIRSPAMPTSGWSFDRLRKAWGVSMGRISEQQRIREDASLFSCHVDVLKQLPFSQNKQCECSGTVGPFFRYYTGIWKGKGFTSAQSSLVAESGLVMYADASTGCEISSFLAQKQWNGVSSNLR